MLDFYAVDSLDPWPDDIPRESRWVGSMDLREFRSCEAALQACLSRLGIDGPYFKDWVVPRDDVRALVRCLRESAAASDTALNPRSGLGSIILIIARAEGSMLLAVCD